MKTLQKFKRPTEDETTAVGRFAAYTVKARAEGRLAWCRILMITAYIAIVVAYLVLFLVIIKFPAMVTFVPILIWILFYFTWYFVKIEYEYRIEKGVLSARRIYGERYCKTLCSVPVASLEAFSPLSEAGISDIPAKRQIWCCSSVHAPALYASRFEKDGEVFVLIVELSDQAKRVLRVTE